MMLPHGRLASAVVRKVTLHGFRNHAEAVFDLGSGRTAIVGPNGSGKTNILEALSLLSPGRGLRRATVSEMTPVGSDHFSVSALVDREDVGIRIDTGTSSGSSVRRVRIDGVEAASSNSLLDHLRIIWLTTDMDRLFSQPPEVRRRFLDRFVLSVDAEHGSRMTRYERSLRTRNAILKDGGGERALFAADMDFSRLASEVDEARRSGVDVLSSFLDELPDNGFPKPLVRYSRGMEGDGSAEAIAERLVSRRPAERSAGRTLEGPHRADLEAVHAQKGNPAAICSTGEQKAIVVSLVLAQAAAARSSNGVPPIVLMDEAGAHLSPGRREAMFASLDAIGSQVVMTGTEETFFDPVKTTTDFVRISGLRSTLPAAHLPGR